LGLEARVGLHTGEIEQRGDDIAGIAVHIGQRVSQAAEPGEVLVSRTVVDVVAGSGIEFDDRGEHTNSRAFPLPGNSFGSSSENGSPSLHRLTPLGGFGAPPVCRRSGAERLSAS